MKLIFLGGTDSEDNEKVFLEYETLLETDDPLISFIPSYSFEAESEFRDFVFNMRENLGYERFLYCPIDKNLNSVFVKEVLKSDLIYLGGGNTYDFLSFMRSSGFSSLLKKFVKNGGILSGLSAGGILMTQEITTAGYPPFDKDENRDNIKNIKGLKLVKFDFFPHYKNSKRYNDVLLKESKKISRPIYAIPDDGAIVVNGDAITFIGRCASFYRGKKVSLY